jgi:RhtB (resistance to homoserine/threonine) family protein
VFNWVELFSIAVIHFFAVASPGPDFAVVLKQSMQQGRLPALITSLGIGFGILLHVSYSLVGIGLIIQTTPWLLNLLLYVAAAYLAWIGWSGLRSKPSEINHEIPTAHTNKTLAKSFALGFVTNGLNPKATLFFLSLFTVAISVDTSTQDKIIYGIYMAVATTLWFSFVSLVITHKKVRYFYQDNAYIFDRIMGAVLIVMALLLLLSN